MTVMRRDWRKEREGQHMGRKGRCINERKVMTDGKGIQGN